MVMIMYSVKVSQLVTVKSEPKNKVLTMMIIFIINWLCSKKIWLRVHLYNNASVNLTNFSTKSSRKACLKWYATVFKRKNHIGLNSACIDCMARILC